MFEINQHVKIIRTQKEVIIDALREDLKPGIMVYETKTVTGKFAGFHREDELDPIIEVVTFNQWDYYARRIEGSNLKQFGHSLTFSGIARRAHSFIVCEDSYTKTMEVKRGWRRAMKVDLT
jgi:hypothetical protein